MKDTTNAGVGASAVADHPFQPVGAWFTVCRTCGLAEAAHTRTTLTEQDRT